MSVSYQAVGWNRTKRIYDTILAGGLLVYLGVGCTLLGYIGWTMALRQVDASRAVAYLYAVPPMAVVIGALTLSERVTGWLALGCALVVSGVAITQVQR